MYLQVIRLRKGQIGRAWENLCMAMLGEQFMVSYWIKELILTIIKVDTFSEQHIDSSKSSRIASTLQVAVS